MNFSRFHNHSNATLSMSRYKSECRGLGESYYNKIQTCVRDVRVPQAIQSMFPTPPFDRPKNVCPNVNSFLKIRIFNSRGIRIRKSQRSALSFRFFFLHMAADIYSWFTWSRALKVAHRAITGNARPMNARPNYSLGILVVQIYFLPTSRPCIKHYSQLVFELVPEVQLLPNW